MRTNHSVVTWRKLKEEMCLKGANHVSQLLTVQYLLYFVDDLLIDIGWFAKKLCLNRILVGIILVLTTMIGTKTFNIFPNNVELFVFR